MKRRQCLGLTFLGASLGLPAAAQPSVCAGDGSPAQFIPKQMPDPNPLGHEFSRYARCPYCGMDRREHHRARMLVQYSDDLVDGVCSIHCLALSLGLNIDRDPKSIWGTDYGSALDPRPLVPVEQLHFLIGADLKHAMTKRSKHGFASPEVARQFQSRHGGTLAAFDEALREAYLDMAADVAMIRKLRAERRRAAAKQG